MSSVTLRLDDRAFRFRLAKLRDVEVKRVVQKTLFRTAFDARDASRKYAETRTFRKSDRTNAKKFVTGRNNRAGIIALGMNRTREGEAKVITAGKTRSILPDHYRGSTITKASTKSKKTARRLVTENYISMPARKVRRNARGQVKFSRYATAAEYRKAYLVPARKGQWSGSREDNMLLAVRTNRASPAAPKRSKYTRGESRVAYVLFLKRRAKLDKRFPFYRIVHSSAQKNIERQFLKAWRQEVKSWRR